MTIVIIVTLIACFFLGFVALNSLCEVWKTKPKCWLIIGITDIVVTGASLCGMYLLCHMLI